MGLPLWARLVIGAGLAAVLAYVTTPLAIATARRFAFYDAPVGYKGHTRPTPCLGGAAVMLGFAPAALIGAGDFTHVLPLLGGIAALLAAGTIDDRRTLSPQLRVTIELALGVLLSAAGLGWHLGSGPLDAVVTAIWVVAVVNAFNLFDNMDGAASTMGLVVAAAACALALVSGNHWVAAGSAALCGACVGFLPHNMSSPARIFLGDGGSLPLGFAVAALVANAAWSAEHSSLALLAGFLLVGVPALDTCLVIVSRRRRGVSVLTGGQDHLTHRTRRRLGTPRRVALVLGAVQGLVSVLVIVASRGSSPALVYIVLVFVVGAGAVIVALEDAIPAGTGAGAAAGPGATAPALAAATEVHDSTRRPPRGARTQQPTSAPDPGRRWGRLEPVQVAALIALGLGAGLSAFFSAYYATGVWVTIGLVLVIAAAGAMIARPVSFSLPIALVLGGCALLGVWSLLSVGWAASTEQATIEGNRWLSYFALLLLAVVLLRGRRLATLLLAAVGVGIAIVAGSVLVRMLGGDPGSLFLGGRLSSPLGYVNGEGCLFAMGCWLAVALAERHQAVLAGLGVAAAAVLAGLTLLSQSRGAAIAMAATALIAVLVVPGARRRLLALAFGGAGLVPAVSPLLRLYRDGQAGAVPASVAHKAVAVLLLTGLAAGLLWGLLVACERLLESRGTRESSMFRRAGTAVAVAVVLVPAAIGLVRLSSIEHTISTQWHAFVHLSDQSTPGTQTRLFSGGGNRYDYWRVAWHVFVSHPVAGVGAGNYSRWYFRERHTTESIQNPHSLELQVLSELGIVGAIALALMVTGVVIAVGRLRPAARLPGTPRTLLLAGTALTTMWFVYTSGDWMHLLPGVTAIALLAAAVLLYEPSDADRPTGANESPGASEPAGVSEPARARSRFSGLDLRGRRVLLAGTALVTVLLAIAGASLLRTGLTRRFLDDARGELAANPAAAITDAVSALKVDSGNLDAYYVKAAGLARFDRPRAARLTLLQAASKDPDQFVTWVLLGDLEVRLQHFRQARKFYTRAHGLDPSDPSIAQLARDPRSAVTG